MNPTTDGAPVSDPAGLPDRGVRTHGRFDHISFTGWKAEGESRIRPSPVPVLRSQASPVPSFAELDEENSGFLDSVFNAAGLDRTAYRPGPLLRRIPACLRALRTGSIPEAEKILASHPERLPRAIHALLIGTTEFFRDAVVFDVLQHSVVPALLERRRYPRVWSVACSEGQELYSVAMMFALRGDLAAGQFLGTDCRPQAIAHARRGLYPAAASAGIREPYRSLHTVAGLSGVTIAPVLRRAIDWHVGDIFEEGSVGSERSWDLILCRNLSIYLDPDAGARLWDKLATALEPGGILAVGKAEKPLVPSLQKIAPSIYRKVPCPPPS